MSELQDQDKSFYPLVLILILYTVFFSAVAIWRYEHFLCDDSGDLLIFEQVIHNTTQGKWFYNNFSLNSHFGDHNSPMLALLVPFAFLIPAPYVLYIFTVLSVSISAIPIYLLSRDYLHDRSIALLLTLSYLMLPTFVGQAYLSFHEMNLVLPFLTFAFYFFVRENFCAFIAMFTMGMLVKEDVALSLFMFAPYALLKKRSLRWIVTPAVLSIAWFLLSIKVIIPFFNKSSSYALALGYFSDIGNSLSEIVINTITKPAKTLGMLLRPVNFQYLFLLLFPAGLILPLLTAEIIFTVPSVFFNLLAGTQRFRFFTAIIDSDTILIPRHMSLIATVFIFISTILAIKKIISYFPILSKKTMLLIALILLCAVIYNDRFIFSKYFYYEDPSIVMYSPSINSTNKILSLIPSSATVKSNISIANHLYDKREAYYPADKPVDSDYVIVTNQDTIKFNPDQIVKLSYEYKLIESENNIFLYKKI